MSLIRLGSAATRRQRNRPDVEAAADRGSLSPNVIGTTTETETATERAFESLVQYFPAETVTLFLAAISVVHSLDQVPFVAGLHPLWLVAIFTIVTPVMLLVAAYATFRESQRAGTIPSDQHFQLPVFDLVASAIAFVPWALAVPGLFPDPDKSADPQALSAWTNEVVQVFAAFLAFAVSWFLSQLRRIFGDV